MSPISNHPAVLALLCILLLWLSTLAGASLAARTSGSHPPAESRLKSLALAAILALLGLLLGMTLANAVTRRAQRQLSEQQEATAIRSAYIRARLLTPPQSAATRTLLAQYLNRRIAAYNVSSLNLADLEAAALPPRLWQVIVVFTPARRLPAATLVVESLNSVFNARSYAHRVRPACISPTDWLLLLTLAALTSLLAGFALTPPATPGAGVSWFLILLPALIATSFFLIGYLDQPTTGLGRNHSPALTALARDLSHLP